MYQRRIFLKWFFQANQGEQVGAGAQSEKKTPEIRWLSRSEDDDDYNEDEDCKDYDDVNENANY